MKIHEYKTMEAQLRLTDAVVFLKTIPMLEGELLGGLYAPLEVNIETGCGDTLNFVQSKSGYGIYDYQGLVKDSPTTSTKERHMDES